MWNDEKNAPEQFTLSQGPDFLFVDFDAETEKKYTDYLEKKQKRIAAIEEEHNKKTIKRGSFIKAYKGRKSVGKTGEVYAIYSNPYDEYNPKVYFKDSEGNKHNAYFANIYILASGQWTDPNLEKYSHKGMVSGTGVC